MRVVEVVQAGGADDPRLYIKNAYSGDWMDVRAFSWGARIPTSPRLEAMEAVVRSSPLVDIDRKGNIVMCRFCLADPQGADEPFEHLSDCVWSRSQREKPKEDA